ncbi:MFS transporter [Haloferula chungangensis]|uniref:MFS transporter n=1 Tax=Haloferula chungangensis TaxID=1048331 RepID=A0ABW2L230_9BACT
MGGLGLMFFLLGMSPGFYVPALTNLLSERGFDSMVVQWAWLSGPVAALISPLCVGALADNRFSGEKVMGWLGLISSVLLGGAFLVLDLGCPAWVFLVLMFLCAIISAPMWSMLASISMAHLRSGEREFPLVRLGATFGWAIAGLITSFVLNADGTVVSGYAAAGVRLLGGFAAFYLPSTPPPGRSRSWRTLLGMDAFRLLKERDHLVFFSVAALWSMPVAAFYMWAPKHLAELGDTKASATMALGQVSEVVAMVLMASLMTRFRVKTLLTLALGLSVLRYALFAWSGMDGTRTGLMIGISLHGFCYTFFFITAQLFLDRRVPIEMRSQAQGLLALFSGGIGSLIGTIAVRQLYDFAVVGEHGSWTSYWSILAAVIVMITVGFVALYKGVAPSNPSR